MIKKTLEYWHIQEFLLPQSLESSDSINKDLKGTRKAFEGNTNNILKWIGEISKCPLEKGLVWQFMIYGGMYKVNDVKEQLLKIFDETDDTESHEIKDNAATFAFCLDIATKRIKLDNIQVSTAPWALKRISTNPYNINLDLSDFNNDLELMRNKLQQDVYSIPLLCSIVTHAKSS